MKYLILFALLASACGGVKVQPLTKPQIIQLVQLDLIAVDEIAIALTKTQGNLHISNQSQKLIHDFVLSARVALDSYNTNPDIIPTVTKSLSVLTTNLSADLRTNQTVRDILFAIGSNLEKL